jgi:hypothetical protein
MTAKDFEFISVWRLQATMPEVFDVLADGLSMPIWWPAVFLDSCELEPAGANGLGRVLDQHAKGWLPYTLHWQSRLTDKEPCSRLTVEARGDFVGWGRWTLAQDGEWTVATYAWNVRLNKPVLRRFTSVMEPIFSANHSWAMARGEESLALEIARCRATTPAERACIPAPPRPTPSLGPALLATGSAARRLLRRLGQRAP